jgi:hypothetical protein
MNSSEVPMSDPVSFKRVFILASTMFVAIGGVLMLYVDATGSGEGDEPESRALALPMLPLPVVREPTYPTPAGLVPALLASASFPVLVSAPTPPALLPIELRPAQRPQESQEPLWPLTLSYHEATVDPAYYRAWLEAKNPGVHFRAVKAIVTGYCPCPICCGAHARGITFTGVRTSIEPYGVAAPEALVRHSIHVPGYLFESEPGKFWKADDTGGALNQDWTSQHTYHFDVRFMSHDWAMRWWGLRKMTVYISE